ncbi:hypothetical protein LSTR_LSTR000783 [Laodelphax striatellus]|uniref:Uncharacterized protein n=1 Tax=Laodelphax striatellus TaxID=195883 RepID=A0A482XHN3_LAOST|nr:hypothetical protein LSTR_LSTR000783 [Laodelphax striatellus]
MNKLAVAFLVFVSMMVAVCLAAPADSDPAPKEVLKGAESYYSPYYTPYYHYYRYPYYVHPHYHYYYSG